MTEQELQADTNKKVNEIHTALFGVPDSDDRGLCGELKEVRKDFYSFRRVCIWVGGLLVGSGLLSLGWIELFKG
jgi:hypothetical protein